MTSVPKRIQPLNPRFLTPAASLNRARIVSLPGLKVDEGILHKTGYELASARALAAHFQTQKTRLKHPPHKGIGQSVHSFIFFDQCLTSSDPEVREAAREIARAFGRGLGWLLVMLRRGDPPNREDRTDWDDSYWEHWRTLPSLVLGGGLIRGRLRDHLLEDIQAVFSETSTSAPILSLDPHGEYLPLVGALRCAPLGYARILALDFGGTQVKRAVGQCGEGRLLALKTHPPLDSNIFGTALTNRLMEQTLEWMITAITTSWHEARPDCPVIPVSLAAYVDPQGRPLDRQGSIYAMLNALCSDLQQELTKAVSYGVGHAVQVKLIHDGTASATVHPGSAVITLGTALGVGFAPAVDQPLPLEWPLERL